MDSRTLRTAILSATLLVAGALALACDSSPDPSFDSGETPSRAATSAPAPAPAPSRAEAAPTETAASQLGPAAIDPASAVARTIAFTGTRDETERFVGYYKSIRLTPEQERIKEKALSAIPAPCCADNPLSTCCCPCNLAKAAWGLSASLITEQGFGAEEVRQAAQDWLAAAGPNGFSGDACYTGGCNRPISRNGCSGMNDRHVL